MTHFKITMPNGKIYSSRTEEKGTTMTQFADDFEITQDQADAINARIAAGEEYAELYGDINEHRAEPTGEEAPTMTTTTPAELREQAAEKYRQVYDAKAAGDNETARHRGYEAQRLEKQAEAAEKENTMQTTTANKIKFDCIANLIHRYDRATHGYYFSNDTMKFFSAKTYEPVYRVGDTEVFVDSIRDTYSNQPRQYRVKEWNGSDSSIETVIEYKTLRSAEKAARRHAESLANQ